MAAANENELLDYEEETDQPDQNAAAGAQKKDVKGTYVSIHSSGFRDFLLKPELLRAIIDCGFEHPSEGMSFLSVFFFSHHFVLQFNMNVSLKQFLVWIFCVKPNLVWVKPQFLSWPLFNKLTLSTDRFVKL